MKQLASDTLATLLSIGSMRLALPQKEVISVELLERPIVAAKAPVAAVYNKAGYDFPVYAFSDTLALTMQIPPQRRYFALLAAANGLAFGTVCDQTASLVLSADLDKNRLPECMRLPFSPVDGLIYYEDQVVLATDTLALWRYINHLGRAHG